MANELSDLDHAIILTVEAHSRQKRKGTTIPYILHPLEAMTIVSTMTNDPEILAAAVLHDTVEDTGITALQIQNEFGQMVYDLVMSQTEDKRTSKAASETWKIRKEETLNKMSHMSIPEKMLTLGDKLSNLRAIHRDYLKIGNRLWARFNNKDAAEHGWYYQGIADRLSELSKYPAYREYRSLLDAMFSQSEI